MAPADSVRVSRVRTYSGAQREGNRFRVRDFHPLRFSFQRIPLANSFLTPLAILVRLSGPSTPATQRPVLDTSQVWAVPVSLATTQGIEFSFFSPATEMFHFAGRPLPILCVQMGVPLRVGFPIRKSPDRSLLAAPRSLSQLTASFIGIRCQGIHHVPLVA